MKILDRDIFAGKESVYAYALKEQNGKYYAECYVDGTLRTTYDLGNDESDAYAEFDAMVELKKELLGLLKLQGENND